MKGVIFICFNPRILERFEVSKCAKHAKFSGMYHVSCEPLRIFWNDDTTCSTLPCHECCLLWAGFQDFKPVVDNTRGTRVEQAVSPFQKILRGLQLTWYFWFCAFSIPYTVFLEMCCFFWSLVAVWLWFNGGGGVLGVGSRTDEYGELL